MFGVDRPPVENDAASRNRGTEAPYRSPSVRDFAWRSAAKIRVLVAHALPVVSARLCLVLNGLADYEARAWDDQLQHEFNSPSETGAEVVVSDPACGMQLLKSILQQDKTGSVSSNVVIVLLRDFHALDSDGVRRLMRLEQPSPSRPTMPTPSITSTRQFKGGLPPKALRRVCEHVGDHFANKLRHQDLAAIAGLSESHFSRAFKESVGMSPHRYVSWRRVEAAAEMLAETARPLSEISLAVGFSDQSHFTRTFHRLMGETPGAFRHRHR